MNPIQTSCNPCESGNCGRCVADSLQRKNFIRDPKNHCKCCGDSHNITQYPNRNEGIKHKTLLGSKGPEDTSGPKWKIITNTDSEFTEDQEQQ